MSQRAVSIGTRSGDFGRGGGREGHSGVAPGGLPKVTWRGCCSSIEPLTFGAECFIKVGKFSRNRGNLRQLGREFSSPRFDTPQ